MKFHIGADPGSWGEAAGEVDTLDEAFAQIARWMPYHYNGYIHDVEQGVVYYVTRQPFVEIEELK
jgi:hypothetical protein